MSGRAGRERNPIGGLGLGIVTMAAVGGFVFLAGQSLDISARREVARQTAQAYCQKADKEDCKTLNTDVRAGRAAEDAVDVAVWQLWLNVAGLFGLAFTVLYARAAWLEAEKSANAAHDTLEASKSDAAEQAKRFHDQLNIAKESVDAARQAIVTADRAWVTVGAELAGPLTFDSQNVSVDIDWTLQNIGRSPATNVLLDYGMFSTAGAADQKVRDNVARGRYVGPLNNGIVLLPRERRQGTVTLSIPLSAFMDGCADMRRLRIAEGDDDTTATNFPALMLGTAYALPGDKLRRFTYLFYFIMRSQGPPWDFDGSDGVFELADIELKIGWQTGPIT
jgi:hypothetical protein